MCHRPLIPSAFPDGDESAGETLGELSIGDLRPAETKGPGRQSTIYDPCTLTPIRLTFTLLTRGEISQQEDAIVGN